MSDSDDYLKDALIFVGGIAADEIARPQIQAVVKAGKDLVRRTDEEAQKLYVKGWAVLVTVLAKRKGKPVQETIEELAEASEQERKTLRSSINQMMEAIDEVAWPYLARLAAEYIEGTKPRDRFFVSACDLLRRSTVDDVEGICCFLSGLEATRQAMVERGSTAQSANNDYQTWAITTEHDGFSFQFSVIHADQSCTEHTLNVKREGAPDLQKVGRVLLNAGLLDVEVSSTFSYASASQHGDMRLRELFLENLTSSTWVVETKSVHKPPIGPFTPNAETGDR